MTGLEDEAELAFWLPAWMVMPDLFRNPVRGKMMCSTWKETSKPFSAPQLIAKKAQTN